MCSSKARPLGDFRMEAAENEKVEVQWFPRGGLDVGGEMEMKDGSEARGSLVSQTRNPGR